MSSQYDLFQTSNELLNKNLGIRLKRLEFLNWGTFNRKIWVFKADGENSLITGESGSGKSSIVDALQTLLIGGRKLSYNQAAGSGANERSLDTYVLGTVGKKLDENGKDSPENLRTYKDYTVILGVFEDKFIGRTVTLAVLVYYTEENNASLKKYYFVGTGDMSIQNDFAGFKGNIRSLGDYMKKRDVMYTRTYADYLAKYSQLLGGIDEQALKLFQQSIYMKKVDSLTEFVSDYILEYDEDIDDNIGKLVDHFDALTDSYNKSKKAHEQVEELNPIHKMGEDVEIKKENIQRLKSTYNAMDPWIHMHKKVFFEKNLDTLNREKNEICLNLEVKTEKLNEVKREIGKLNVNIGNSGGTALENYRERLVEYNKNKKNIEENYKKYEEKAKVVGLKAPDTIEEFNSNIEKAAEIQGDIAFESGKLKQEEQSLYNELSFNDKKTKEIEIEIKSLEKRDNNIPDKLIRIQKQICDYVGVEQKDIPFIGELIEVADQQWEGAIERLLHGFALSLIVPKHLYIDVSKYIEKNYLKTKLVYFYVDLAFDKGEINIADKDSVIQKLRIKEESEYKDWIKKQLFKRFNYICCNSVNEFKNYEKALSINGQIKNKNRHEKDDREKINNRKHFCLGFSNKKKLKALKIDLNECREIENNLKEQIGKVEQQWERLEEAKKAVYSILGENNFENLDIKSLENKIAEIEKMISQLENDDKLKSLIRKLEEKEKEEKEINIRIGKLNQSLGKVKDNISKNENSLKYSMQVLEENEPLEELKTEFDLINFTLEQATKLVLNLETIDKIERDIKSILSKKIEEIESEVAQLESRLVRDISKFVTKYELKEMDGTLESLQECNRMREELQKDKLYKHQQTLEKELYKKPLIWIASIHSKLMENEKHITDKINKINGVLRGIDFNYGRYINIVKAESVDMEINNFKVKIRQLMSLDNDNLEKRKEKFEIAKELIEKFRNRDTDTLDGKWVKKVTDVRKWFIFSATERYRENDEEYEYYSDSSGKSGGQKEKLAYTILGAGLLYNYSLKKNTLSDRSTTFRMIVVDEAFLKSSEEAARFGLELFKQLKFQFIVVTPGNNINTISEYIKNVCYTKQNQSTRESIVLNMSIDEYIEKVKKEE